MAMKYLLSPFVHVIYSRSIV